MKNIIYFLIPFLFIFNIAKALTFEEASKAIMNCADKNFFLENVSHNVEIPQWSKFNNGRVENWIPKVKDKFILEYTQQFPINYIDNLDVIKKNREELMSKWRSAIFESANDEQKKIILEFEDKRNKSEYKFLLNAERIKVYKKIRDTLNSEKIDNAEKERKVFNDKDLINLKANIRAVSLSKRSFFEKMSIKDKLQIKTYKKEHIKCEKSYDKSKITFIQEWN